MKPVGPSIECSLAMKDNPGERITFESFPESSMKESYTPKWSVRDISRTTVATSVRYTGGSEGDIPINLRFLAGAFSARRPIISGNNKQAMLDLDGILQQLEAKVMFIKALCFPRPKVPRTIEQRAGRSIGGDPPRVILTIGRFRTYEGVLQSFSVDWKPPYHPTSGRPYAADVTSSLQIIHEFYPDWYDIRGVPLKKTPPSLSAVVNQGGGLGGGIGAFGGIGVDFHSVVGR